MYCKCKSNYSISEAQAQHEMISKIYFVSNVPIARYDRQAKPIKLMMMIAHNEDYHELNPMRKRIHETRSKSNVSYSTEEMGNIGWLLDW